MKRLSFSLALALATVVGLSARPAHSDSEPVDSETAGSNSAGVPSAGIEHEHHPPPDEHAGAGHAGAGHAGAQHAGAQDAHAEHSDPSRHFNFLNLNYRGKDEYGGAYGDNRMVTPDGQVIDEEEPMSAPFVFLVLNFALLVIILVKYLWPAAGKLAIERHDQIKSALDEAARLREQAKRKLAEYELRIKDVDREIKALVDGIRADAEADRARMLDTAAAQAAQMKKDADQRIAAEIELARAQLTKEVTTAAAQAAEKLLKDKTTVDDQRKLVSSFISDISGAN